MAVKSSPKKRKSVRNGTRKKATEQTPESVDTTPKPEIKPVLIDYPQEGESILPGHYAVRVAADQNAQVEVSVNDTDWIACRTADGFYWFDWWPSQPGKNNIKARQRTPDGNWVVSKKRSCKLKPSES